MCCFNFGIRNIFVPDLTRVKIVSKDVEKEKNIRGFETDEIFK